MSQKKQKPYELSNGDEKVLKPNFNGAIEYSLKKREKCRPRSFA